MATKANQRRRTADKAVRHSVTLPGPLASEVRRVAKERHLSMSRALVSLAERGVQAEHEAQKNLTSTYETFMAEENPTCKDAAGKGLIRAIFGKHAIAEDPLR
jgi:predicted DNA-binding ribbon-helix-helix protein